MLAFKVMEVLRRGRGASLLAVCAAFIALQCGQEEFDLLSAGQAAGGPPAMGGQGTSGGAPNSGGSPSVEGGRSNEPKPPPAGCNHNDDCREQWTPFCVDNRCVQCRENPAQGCPDELTCDRGTCRLPCKDDECRDWGRCLTERNVCVECRNASDCDSRLPFCINNYCRGCRSENDCGDELPFCINNFCRGCRTENDCGDPLPFCVDNFCRECEWAGDCASGQQCSVYKECCSPSNSGCPF